MAHLGSSKFPLAPLAAKWFFWRHLAGATVTVRRPRRSWSQTLFGLSDAAKAAEAEVNARVCEYVFVCECMCACEGVRVRVVNVCALELLDLGVGSNPTTHTGLG